jgi:hypothetical protein
MPLSPKEETNFNPTVAIVCVGHPTIQNRDNRNLLPCISRLLASDNQWGDRSACTSGVSVHEVYQRP